MREGWKTYKLGSICDFHGGSQPPKGEWIKFPKEGYVRMLQIRDFTKSRDFDIEYVRLTDKLRLCKEDDILIGRYGASVGKILTGLAGAYNVAIIKATPDENVVCKSFIRRVFEAPGFQALLGKVSTQRTAQAGFSKEDIADYEVSLPSLPEQQRIVDILDREFAKIDALKANAEKSLQAAKDLFQATLKKELEPKEGWKIRTIAEVCEIRSGRNQKAVENPNGIYPIYGSGGIMGYADDFLCDAGATIIGRKGSINNPIFVETKFWNVDTAFGFSPKENIIPKFLFYFCKSFNFQDMNKGTTIPSLVKTDLLQIAFPEPFSIKEQQDIVSRLDDLNEKCNTLQDNYQKTLALCDNLKLSLLRKAFNGEL